MQTALVTKRDIDHIHQRLRNWGAFQRANADDGPPETPRSASWQDQVTGRVRSIDPPEEHYIDDVDAEKVQQAVVLCMQQDRTSALVLIQHYYHRNYAAAALVPAALNRFWRYLFW